MGTLAQLKILLNHGASLAPAKNMKGCEDFFSVILHAHVNAAVEKLLSEQSYDNVEDLSIAIVQNYICFDPTKKICRDDKLHLYATQLMILLSFWHAFNDAVKKAMVTDHQSLEIFTCNFSGERAKNYCKEAIMILSHYYYLLSDCMAAKLKWSRFVNTAGRKGKNVSCDLHLEDLNRLDNWFKVQCC